MSVCQNAHSGNLILLKREVNISFISAYLFLKLGLLFSYVS